VPFNPLQLTLGLGPPSGVSIGRLSGVCVLWDCVPRVYSGGGGCTGGGVSLDLYKIFFYVEAFVYESIILEFPPPTCIAHPGAILLHDDWTV